MNSPFATFLPMERELDAELRSALNRVFERSWYIGGKEDEAFEKAFSDYIGAKCCVGVGNGLDALTLSLRALSIGEGDEVIVPSNTCIATARAVTYAGATPVFAEPDISTYNLDPEQFRAKITPRTKAVIAVDLGGIVADYDKIYKVVRKKRSLFRPLAPDGTELTILQKDNEAFVYVYLPDSFFEMHLLGDGALSDADVDAIADNLNYGNIGR